MKAIAVIATLGTVAGVARGDDRTAVITTQALALVGHGVSVGYERLVAPRLSAAGLVGVRRAAEGDFSSTTLTAGGELRLWQRPHVMRGLYLGFHGSVARTQLTDDTMDAGVGSSIDVTERFDVGWRFVAWRRFAIAPSLGLGMHQDIDTSGRLATVNAGALMIGLELGWLL
jgi:hypothetical protein